MIRFTASKFVAGILAMGFALAFQPMSASAQTLDELVATCAGCHGENGVPIDKTIPNIWGQKRAYLLNQLLDFKRGHRKNEQMDPMVEPLTKENMEELATYYSKLAWPNLEHAAVTDEVKAQARAILDPLNCRGCHQEHYQGDTIRPRLAGQQDEYLVKTMTDFHTGDRKTYIGMVALMKSVDAEHIKSLGAYLAGLQIPDRVKK